MTNLEKYRNEIINFKPKEGESNGNSHFCSRFITPKILEPMGKECSDLICSQCYTLMLMWLMDEYKEPETDWSKVPVDTKICVSENGGIWHHRHFAKYENGRVYAWVHGNTSWSCSKTTDWKYAELAEVEDD